MGGIGAYKYSEIVLLWIWALDKSWVGIGFTVIQIESTIDWGHGRSVLESQPWGNRRREISLFF